MPKVIIPPDMDILPPTDDRIFKTLLTHPDAKPVLKNIISAVIERPVLEVLVRNNELPTTDVSEKNERLDVNCIIDDGDQINVEMQASRIEETGGEHKNFVNKSIYFLTDLHSSQKSKGVEYHNLVRTYQITFCSYTVFPDRPNFVNHFSLRTPDGWQVSDQVNMAIIELSKMRKKSVDSLTPLEMWSFFLKFAPDSNPNYRNLINEIINQKEEISMATTLLMEISQDEHEKARLRSQKKAEMDLFTNMRTAETRGEARGIVIGETRGMAKERERVIELIEKGLSLDEIRKRLS